MSPTNNNSSLLHMLRQQLAAARSRDAAILANNTKGTPIQVPGTGKTLTNAYEQLRNAAEYAEEHLLLQRAIQRFFNRNFTFFTVRNGHVDRVGEELIIELTQAGYLRNGAFSTETAEHIRILAEEYLQTYSRLREAHVSRDQAMELILSTLAIEVESILNPHSHFTAIAYSAYQHYLDLLSKDQLATTKEEMDQYEICLYLAVHQALLKSDITEARYDLMQLYRQSPHDAHAFVRFNKMVDELYFSPFTHRLKRTVSKLGAPIRILKSLADERDDLPELLDDRDQFLDTFSQQTHKEYHRIQRRLSRGIVKSIIFLVITKFLIGLAIEVPYDIWAHGSVAWLPLAVNLLFPPVYMASLKLGIHVPTTANAGALREYIDTVLYTDKMPAVPLLRDSFKPASMLHRWLFTVLFFVPFAITVYALLLMNFNIVQGLIFFAFMSTASFLGFRLGSMVRDLELVTHQLGFLANFRDFFYIPFILLGQWLSSKYAKINAVAYFLDIAIELPLKTVLRLIRQWTRFLNEKHEELY